MILAASCRPWPKAIAAAETVWALRKPRPTLVGLRRRNDQRIASITAYARANPTNGETTPGTSTLSNTPSHCTGELDATAAPTSPPIRACDEEEGSPRDQVRMFHAKAPKSAANTTTRLLGPGGSVMMPLPTVLATLAPKNEPSRLKTAAMPRATRGLSARVDTDVAMALAASWKPLV